MKDEFGFYEDSGGGVMLAGNIDEWAGRENSVGALLAMNLLRKHRNSVAKAKAELGAICRRLSEDGDAAIELADLIANRSPGNDATTLPKFVARTFSELVCVLPDKILIYICQTAMEELSEAE